MTGGRNIGMICALSTAAALALGGGGIVAARAEDDLGQRKLRELREHEQIERAERHRRHREARERRDLKARAAARKRREDLENGIDPTNGNPLSRQQRRQIARKGYYA